jgi:hypothetical protein
VTEEKRKALEELDKEAARRHRIIRENWRKTHPLKGKGEGDIEAKKALEKEMALRYKEILEKYSE